MMIVSASRRTDIPAYYGEWFVSRIKEGFVDVPNPFNKKQISRVDLRPENVDCFVFWTKNPKNFIHHLPLLDEMGYSYYFQFTLTPYDSAIEKNLPIKREILNTFKILSSKIGSDRVVWRYDPIILSETFSVNYHIDNFSSMSNELTGYTERVIVSMVNPYRKVIKKLKEIGYISPLDSQVNLLIQSLIELGRDKSIPLFSCSQNITGLERSACIDSDLINRITGSNKQYKRDKNQREECSCVKSRDIGLYNSCKAGCIYCYAT